MIQPAIDPAPKDPPPPDSFPGNAEIAEKNPVADRTAGISPGQRPIPHHGKDGTLVALQSLMTIIVIAIFILTFCVQPFRIPSGSMEPSLLIGDFLLVDKQNSPTGKPDWLLPQRPIQRGQIVVFHYPVNPAMHLIKRVIGLPGDHIKLRQGQVYVNGRALVEPYTMYLPSAPDSYRDNFPHLQSADPEVNSRWWIRMHRLIEDGELVVPPGDYFVLGDNRNDSEDSRYWGFVPRTAIVGEPFLIYFSLQQPENLTGLPSRPPLVPERHRSGAVDALADFARWDRTLRIVR